MENNDNLLKKILADREIQTRKEGREEAGDGRKSEQLQKFNSAKGLRGSPRTALGKGRWSNTLGGAGKARLLGARCKCYFGN